MQKSTRANRPASHAPLPQSTMQVGERENLMTDITISHPRMALTLTEAMIGQIANGPEGRPLQEQIYKGIG